MQRDGGARLHVQKHVHQPGTNPRSQRTKTNEHGVQAMWWHARHHEPNETMLQELGG